MEWLTIKQVAERYGKNIWTVRKHAYRGKFGNDIKRMGDGNTDIYLIHIDAAKRVYGGQSTEKGEGSND